MRALLSWFFYTLGVIFFMLILSGVYLYIADPFGLREVVPLFMQKSADVATSQETTDAGNGAPPAKTEDKNPVLTAPQEAALEKIGINPAAIPTSVTDAQKTCLIDAVGETRANEIKTGALPTIDELLKAKSCF